MKKNTNSKKNKVSTASNEFTKKMKKIKNLISTESKRIFQSSMDNNFKKEKQ